MRWMRLRVSRPEPIKSTRASAISVVTRMLRARCCLWADPVCAPLPFRISFNSTREPSRAGARPARMPVMVATIRVKSRTVQSSDAISRRGIWGGASPRRALRPANPKQTATPAAPISNTKFSISNCAASRDLRAPRAALTANSRCRAAPRASCMPATFTHAMMRSRATELRRIRRIGRAGAASLSESGVIRTSIPARMRLNCGGSSSASARTSAVNSARACSGATPGRRRARALTNLN